MVYCPPLRQITAPFRALLTSPCTANSSLAIEPLGNAATAYTTGGGPGAGVGAAGVEFVTPVGNDALSAMPLVLPSDEANVAALAPCRAPRVLHLVVRKSRRGVVSESDGEHAVVEIFAPTSIDVTLRLTYYYY